MALAVALPLLGSVVLAVCDRWLPRVALDAMALGWAAATVADLALLWARAGDGHVVAWMGGWRPHAGTSVGIVLVGDRTGTGIALLAALLVLAVVAYSWRYFDEPPRGHSGIFPALVLLFEAGMTGFALTGDLFNAFVFFELMSVAAYALTGYRVEDPRPLQGALTFGVVNSLAAYATLLGIGLLYARTGELGFAQIGTRLARHHADPLLCCAFAFVLVGLLVKAAIVPFHFWLPDAHAVAPTPVCMLLSGVMVELGGYGTARVYWIVFSGPGGIPAPLFRQVMVTAGVLTGLIGCLMCWHQHHIKRLLAFSTVAHSGLFLVGIALLTPEGTAGTALYVAAHAGIKAALFGLTGILLDRYGSVDEHELYGQGRELPFVGVLYTAGALGLAALPPFGTALGKAVAEHAAGRLHGWLPALYVLVSAVTGAAVLRTALRVFVGAGPAPPAERDREEPETGEPARRVPRPMIAVPLVLLAAALAAGLVPAWEAALTRAADVFTDREGYVAAVLHSARPVPPVTPVSGWTAEGVLLGTLSTLLAILLAAVGVWGPTRPKASARALRHVMGRLRARCVLPLVRLHSGRPGDYLAWLVVGLGSLVVWVGVRTG